MAFDINIKQINVNLQAVHSVLISYENGRGWRGSIQYYVDGMKIEKDWYGNDSFPTLELLVKAIQDFINQV